MRSPSGLTHLVHKTSSSSLFSCHIYVHPTLLPNIKDLLHWVILCEDRRTLCCHHKNDRHWVILCEVGQLFTVTTRMVLIELFCVKMGISLRSLPEWSLWSYSVWRWAALYCHYQNDPYGVILYEDGQLFTVTTRIVSIELFCIKMGSSLLSLPN